MSVGAAALDYPLRNDRDVTTSVVLLAAGLLVLVCGGLLVSWRRVEVLQHRVQRMQVILKLREYAEQVLGSMPSGLVLLSPRHHVLFANRSFLERLHLGRDEVIGRRLAEVNGAHDLAFALRQMLEGGAIQDEFVLATATDVGVETRPARIMVKVLSSCDDSQEGQLLMIVEGLAENEYASTVAKSPLRP
jgi:PAS domain-containing protein